MLNKRFSILIGLLFLVIAMTGCTTRTMSYVDPGLKSVNYADLKPGNSGEALGVQVEFQRNGSPYPAAVAFPRQTILRVLNETRLFSSVSSAGVNTGSNLKIVINNTAGQGSGSAVLTGLTYGATGSLAQDRYLISATYTKAGTNPVTKEYQHALLTTIGNKAGPPGLIPHDITTALDIIFEEVTLLLIYDLQKEGLL